MANVDRPNGFKPVGTVSGAPWQGSIMKCISDNDNLFRGDLVIYQDAGYAVGDGAVMGVDRMATGTAGNILGVVVGWEPNPTNLGAAYHTASTTYGVYVCTAPDVILEAQGDTSAIAAADVGLNYDVAIAAGNTTTGVSNMEVDSSSGVTTAATPLKLIGVVNRADNDISTLNNRVLVTVNLHKFRSDAGTAGL